MDDSQAGRKTTGWVQTYPYDYIRDATEAEFLELKAKGDEEIRQQLRDEG